MACGVAGESQGRSRVRETFFSGARDAWRTWLYSFLSISLVLLGLLEHHRHCSLHHPKPEIEV